MCLVSELRVAGEWLTSSTFRSAQSLEESHAVLFARVGPPSLPGRQVLDRRRGAGGRSSLPKPRPLSVWRIASIGWRMSSAYPSE